MVANMFAGEEFDLFFRVARKSLDHLSFVSARVFLAAMLPFAHSFFVLSILNGIWIRGSKTQTIFFSITLIQSIVAVEFSKIERTEDKMRFSFTRSQIESISMPIDKMKSIPKIIWEILYFFFEFWIFPLSSNSIVFEWKKKINQNKEEMKNRGSFNFEENVFFLQGWKRENDLFWGFIVIFSHHQFIYVCVDDLKFCSRDLDGNIYVSIWWKRKLFGILWYVCECEFWYRKLKYLHVVLVFDLWPLILLRCIRPLL